MGNCAGIDWGSEKHDVLIEDPAGEELVAATFAHDEDGVSALCAALVCFAVEVVAIERPDGLLVDRLLEAGVRVLALPPNQVKAARDRVRASGGKSDQFDRFVLCELARTDRHRFRLLEPDCDEAKALRALVRAREDLVGARVALGNQLRAELGRFWPGPIGLFSAIDSPISLAFLARYPSPGRRAEPRGEAHGSVLDRPALLQPQDRSRAVGAAALSAGRSCRRGGDPRPTLSRGAPGRHAANDGRSHQRARVRDLPNARRPSRWGDLPQLLPQPRVGDLRRHHPGGDRRLPRAISTPRRDRRRRRPGPRRQGVRQAQARQVPVGVQQAAAQRALHPRPQHSHVEPLGRCPVRRGQRPRHNHRRALRTLGRAWSRIIWRCWTTRTPYDPTRHTGLQQQITVTIPDRSGSRPDLAATRRTAGETVTRRATRRAERASA